MLRTPSISLSVLSPHCLVRNTICGDCKYEAYCLISLSHYQISSPETRFPVHFDLFTFIDASHKQFVETLSMKFTVLYLSHNTRYPLQKLVSRYILTYSHSSTRVTNSVIAIYLKFKTSAQFFRPEIYFY